MHVFTTGQVAKICKVAPRTVSKWFDSGRLKGYRIPGSHDRRIPREYLIKFLKEHGMPLGSLEDEGFAKILIVSKDNLLLDELRAQMTRERGFKIAVAESAFHAGIQAETLFPDAVILDSRDLAYLEIADACRNLRKHSEFARTIIVMIGRADERIPSEVSQSANESFNRPFDPVLLVTRVHTLVGTMKRLAS